MAEAETGLWKSFRFPLVLGLVCAVSGGSLGLVYSVTKENIEAGRKRKVSEAFAALVPGFEGFSERPGERRGETVYVITGAGGKTIAFAAKTLGEGSYNSMQPIELITVMNGDLTRILGVRVVSSAETPGLGERIKERPAPNSIAGMLAGAPPRRLVLTPSGDKKVLRVVSETPEGVRILDDSGAETFLKGAKVLPGELPPSFLAQFDGKTPDELALSKNGGAIDAISGATVSSTAVLRGVRRAVDLLRRTVSSDARHSSQPGPASSR